MSQIPFAWCGVLAQDLSILVCLLTRTDEGSVAFNVVRWSRMGIDEENRRMQGLFYRLVLRLLSLLLNYCT